MKVSTSNRSALCVSIAAALLAGCGGSQPPIGTPGVMPQSRPIGTRAGHGKSWMLHDAKSSDLLYASNTLTNSLIVLSYPKGKLVGQVTLPDGSPVGLCSDKAGNVWVATSGSFSQSFIYEYVHGGIYPIATLSDPGEADGCAVDPGSGDLAITNYAADDPPFYDGDLAVYTGAQGTPVIYSDANMGYFAFCTYDDGGNLFATGGGGLDELPFGAGVLESITLSKRIAPSSIQWDTMRGNLAVSDSQGGPRQPGEIYQVEVSGSSGTVSGPTVLKTPHNYRPGPQFFVRGSRIVGSAKKGEDIDFWRYPDGGRPSKIIHRPGGATDLAGVTISAAPSR